MDWKEKVCTGMKLIIEGCQGNDSWTNCSDCPFNTFCTSIYMDHNHSFSTPDTWKEEGLSDDILQ